MMWQILTLLGVVLFSATGCDTILGTMPEGQARNDIRGVFIALHLLVLFAGSIILGATL